jgi:hypothetical protein
MEIYIAGHFEISFDRENGATNCKGIPAKRFYAEDRRRASAPDGGGNAGRSCRTGAAA